MVQGGRRKGAGRPKGSGKLGASKTMRIPLDREDEVRELVESKGFRVPVFSSRVAAGMPSPAEDHVEEYVNIYRKLVPEIEHLGITHANGESMVNIGMFDGDMILFSTRETPAHKKIVVARVEGGQTVKRLWIEKGKHYLMPENENFKPIPLDGVEHEIQGVVLWWQRRP